MSLNTAHDWLLTYDIGDPRRLMRVHRHVARQGIHVQYSLFLLRGSTARLDGLLDELAAFIDPRSDQVRVYRLPARPQAVVLGEPILPQDLVPLNGTGWEWLSGEAGSPKAT